MPPKVKTDRAAILNAAFEVAKTQGIPFITAQSVSALLKTSVAPIFREFQTVEELRIATMEKISEFHTQYLKSYPQAEPEFLSYGLAYLHFAKEYPHLFEMIMQTGRTSMEERANGQLAFIINSVQQTGTLSLEQAKALFFQVWVYTHGLSCLVYKGSLHLTDEEVKQLLLEAFHAFYAQSKNKPASERIGEGDTL